MEVQTITIKKTPELVSIFPGVFWAINKPLKLIYKDFSTDSKLVNRKIISGEIQFKCTERFLKKPNKPQNYIVCSDPDYNAAMIFAGYLVSEFIKKYSSNRVIWYNINRYEPDPFYSNLEYRPSLIVISTIFADASLNRIEQIRDLVSHFWNVPKILVGTGMDPLTLAAYRLHIPVNSMFYYKSMLVKSDFNVM